mmetsp:Transcript_56186/g.171121  ORF Transcript_56186/g.171121 Transcript_56186/m.171121 type:complete len:383 (-) Transcript_56186:558-1706(-)
MLVPAHLNCMRMWNLRVVPETQHLAQIPFENYFDLDLELLFYLFPPPLLGEAHVAVAAFDHLEVRYPGVWGHQNLRGLVLADVHQHVSVVDPGARGHLHGLDFPTRALEVVPQHQVVARVIVVHGRVLAARRHGVVVELQPPALQVGADVRVVVAAVHVPAVDDHRVEEVHAGIRRQSRQVQPLVELEARVQLDHVHLLEVEVEALQLQVQHGGEREEADPLLRALLAVPLGLVGVVALERFLRGEFPERLLDAAQFLAALALDVELNVVKRFVAARLVIDVDALDVILHLALEQALDRAIHGPALHLLLDPVAQDPVQLLYIMLREGVHRVPAKRFHQLAAIHGLIRGLQLVEDVLQGLDQRRRLSLALVRALAAADGAFA